MAAFGDLCLPYQSDPRILVKYMSFLVDLGYETIAVDRMIVPDAKGKKNQGTNIPTPPNLDSLPGVDDVKKVCPRLKLLTRITIEVHEQSQLRFLSGDVAQSYDIVSVRPMTEKLLQQICQTAEVDLISFDMKERVSFYYKHPQIKLAIERGISFEINYCPAIRDDTIRRNLISKSLQLINVCKGKNVVLSGSAESVMEIRGPYDVVNLGLLFGLKQDQAKAAVSSNVRSVIYHAMARNKTAKGLFGLEKIDMSLATGKKRSQDMMSSTVTSSALTSSTVASSDLTSSDTIPIKKAKIQVN